MNLLDIRTIVLSNVVTDIVCVWFVAMLWLQSRDRFAGTAFWVFDFAFQAVALVLIVLRGVIPDWISMVLSNTLVISGAILGFLGMERFVGKKGPQIHNVLLLILFIFVHGYFVFVQPSLTARNLNLSIALLLVCFQYVWLVRRRVEPGLRSLTFGVGIVFLLYCLVSVARIAHFFIGAHLESNYLQSGLFEALVLVSYQVLFILLTYNLVLMVNKRLLMQIGTQEEKFSKAFDSAPYAITITRPSDGTIVDVNETFVSITGYDRTEVMGKKTIDLHLWEHDEDRAAVVDILLKKGGVQGMEMPFRKKNGEGITGLFSAEVITIDGEKNILSSIADITERKKAEEQLEHTLESLRKAVGATIQVMVSAVETRDPYTSGHQVRSANLARAIAMEMGLSEDRIDAIRMSGSIHDIGKLSIPAEILSKPTKLSDIEFSLIKEHARQGYEMLKDVESPWPLAEIVRQHHERMDGSGYPRHLKGDDILIEARILAVADVVEAMASHRPYRPGLGLEVALEEIEKNRGITYDNTAADACLKLFREKGFQLEAH